MHKRGLVFGIIILFLGIGVLPCVSGNVVNINATDINMNNSTQGDMKSIRYNYIVVFIVGTIKGKQKDVYLDNAYSFTIVKGLFVMIAGYVYIAPWINYPIYLIYDFKIGFFGNNFVCAAFFIPPLGSTTLI